MPSTGLQEFREVLKSFKELGSLAIQGTVAIPLLNMWARVGPPPSGTISVLTSIVEFLAVMWTYHYWRRASARTLNLLMRVFAAIFCAALLLFGILVQLFTTRPAVDRDRIVHGYRLQPGITQILTPSYNTDDALRDAEFDPGRVWTTESVVAIHTLLVLSWLSAFGSIGFFVSLFTIAHRKRHVN